MENENLIQAEQAQIRPAIKYGWLRALLFLFASIISTGAGSALGLVVVSVIFGVDLLETFQDSSNVIKNLGVWSFMIVNLFGLFALLFIAWIDLLVTVTMTVIQCECD